MSSDHPSGYELGKLVGKYDESMNNLHSSLEKIDKSLEKGEKKMNELDKKVEISIITQRSSTKEIKDDISKIDTSFDKHKKKPHLYHVTEERTRMQRLKHHTPEIIAGGSIGTIVGILALLKQFGVI